MCEDFDKVKKIEFIFRFMAIFPLDLLYHLPYCRLRRCIPSRFKFGIRRGEIKLTWQREFLEFECSFPFTHWQCEERRCQYQVVSISFTMVVGCGHSLTVRWMQRNPSSSFTKRSWESNSWRIIVTKKKEQPSPYTCPPMSAQDPDRLSNSIRSYPFSWSLHCKSPSLSTSARARYTVDQWKS